MTNEKAAEIIEKMILHEKAWLNDFGGKMANERNEALIKAVEQLREITMGKNMKAKRPRTKSLTYEEAKAKGLRSIRMAMCTQLGAMGDVMHPTHDQMVDVMNLTREYTNHLEEHIVVLNDMADTILKETGIDMHIYDEDVKDAYNIADLIKRIGPMDVQRAIRKGWLDIHAEIDEEDYVKIILSDRRTGERAIL